MRFAFKYLKAFTISLQRSMEYRASFFISLLSAVFPIIMQYFLWTAIYGNSHDSSLYGFTYNQMIAYIVLSSIVACIVNTGFEWEIANDIKNGGLNAYIVKPIGYLPYKAACFLGGKSMQLGIMIILVIIICILLNTFLGFVTQFVSVVFFFLSIILALVINFLMFFIMSTSAFWLAEVWGVFAGLAVLINLFSGGLFPIDVFGERIAFVLNYLPFKYTIYFPITVLNGSISQDAILKGLSIQCVWIFILLFVSKLFWNMGTKKYVSIGG